MWLTICPVRKAINSDISCLHKCVTAVSWSSCAVTRSVLQSRNDKKHFFTSCHHRTNRTKKKRKKKKKETKKEKKKNIEKKKKMRLPQIEVDENNAFLKYQL